MVPGVEVWLVGVGTGHYTPIIGGEEALVGVLVGPYLGGQIGRK